MTEYATTVELTVRYRDIDSLGHVNNAVYVTYLEQARVEYVQEVFDTTPLEPDFVVAGLSIDYERPITLGQTVTVGLGVTDIGTASVTIDHEVRADGAVAATAEVTVVSADPDSGQPRPVPDAWRERIAAHENWSLEPATDAESR